MTEASLAAGSSSLPKSRKLTISIVICTYDSQRFDDLIRAVASVQRQTVPADEIVVAVDNNPTLLSRVSSEIPSVIAVSNQFHRGAGGARNSGVSISSGEIVAFIDDDVEASPGWLEHLLPAFASPDVLGVGGRITPKWDGARPVWFPPEFDWVVGCSYVGMPKNTSAVRNVISANMAVRRTVFDAVDGFLPDFGKTGARSEPEETEFCIRARGRFPSMHWLYVPDAIVAHRVPTSRQGLGYFVTRCINEGRGKARMTTVAEDRKVLSTEREYTRKTLPAGVIAGLRLAAQGQPRGLQTAAVIVLGVGITVAAYAVELLNLTIRPVMRTR